MAEKLSQSSWVAFAKKRELDDAPLVKALAAFDKTDEESPDLRLEALQEVDAQIAKLVVALSRRKKELGDKPWKEAKDKLDAMLGESERLTKAARAAKSAAEADDEADSPALLTTKMIPLLRELRKPEVRMHALIASAGKDTAVLIMRRAIGTSRRKLLAEQVDAKGGTKYIAGECLYEKGVLTFVVQSQAGGLAKRVRAALLAQTDLRVKVRVRGENGEQDEDGEDEPTAAGANEAAAGKAAPAAALAAGASAEDGAASAEAQAWARRLEAVRGDYEQALRANHPEATRLRAVMGFAIEKAQTRHDYTAALKALDTLDKSLRQTAAPAAAAGAAGAAADGRQPADGPAGRPTIAPAIVYTQARLAWTATRGRIQKELAKLEGAILEAYRDEPFLPEVTQKVRKLDGVLAMFDETLADSLDRALNAASGDDKQRFHVQAREAIARYQGYLASDPLVQELDGNPFVPITVKATLSTSLATLASKIN